MSDEGSSDAIERGTAVPDPGAVRSLREATVQRPGIHYALVVVGLGLLTVLAGQGFLRFGYAMTLASMREALSFSFAQMGLLATASYVGHAVACAVLGPIVVRYGTRWTVGIALVLVGVAMSLTGAASSFEVAAALQVMAGAAGATAVAPVMGLASAWFVPRYRGTANGAMSAGGPLGSLVTGPLVPLLVAVGPFGWRYSWYVLGLVALIVGLVDLILLRNRPAEEHLAPFGQAAADPWAPAGAIAKVDWRSVYASKAVWHMGGLAFASTLSAISYNTFFAAYLVQERGLAPEAAGQLWALAGATGLVGGLVWGWISDQVGRKPALIGAYLVQAACFLLFATQGGVALFALSALLYGITARANFAIMAALCGDAVGPRLAAAAFGINSLFAGVGMALGPGLAGYLADVTSSFVVAFYGSAAVAVAGAVGASLLREAPARVH